MNQTARQRTISLFGFVLFFMVLGFLVAGNADAFVLQVVDGAGNPVQGYRWMVEEDTTNVVTPGTFSAKTLGVNIHGTYAPVKHKGHAASSVARIPLPSNKRWFVSVLPDGNPDGSPRFTLSGKLVAAGTAKVTVVVNAEPIPTAQISILIFKDIAPINNTPDPGEPGLEGFSILLFDQAGQVSQDAFGNPLGTQYDAAGAVTVLGDGEIHTCSQADVTASLRGCVAVGEAMIKYIAPGKYGVRAVPPPGGIWSQTTTIEGTPGIDVWVKANEPNRLIEFGPGMQHVFIGFVQPFNDVQTLTGPAGTSPSAVSGNIRKVHSFAVQFALSPGPAVEQCWVGLNALERGATVGIYAAPCGNEGTFEIPAVPAGTYQLVAWDTPLDQIFYFSSFIVDGSGAAVDLSNVNFVNSWFGNLQNTIFYDTNQNGFRDCVTDGCDEERLCAATTTPCTVDADCGAGVTCSSGDEVGIDSLNVNIRFRDGTIYQAAPTDVNGEADFNEVFPLFKYYLAEVDFSRLKATGATIVVDDGGVIPEANGWTMPSFDVLNPQPQFCTLADLAGGTIADYGADQTAGTADDVLCTTVGDPIIHPFTFNNLARLEQGVTLVEAFTLYADQTNRIEWGKVDYAAGENGGISGVIVYATTRAEADPGLAATETWEPGIPRVQVNLYADFDGNQQIDDMDGNGRIDLADVNNHPFSFPGPGDVDRNRNGRFDRGDALNVVTSDSWDDNMPTGCQGEVQTVLGQPIRDCAETLKTWNQVRPGVFDGGYAFDVYYPFGPGLFQNPAAEIPLPSNRLYIVEAVPPPGYELVKEEDKNVDFGDTYVVSQLDPEEFLPAPCVGSNHLVPANLTLFPGIPVDPAYAGQLRPLCDKKLVLLSDQQNAAADFHLFTAVPKAARGVGLINNDLALTLDPNSPVLGEKAGASWLPVSVQDFDGNELTRVYTDQFGVYNFLAPSTFSVNVPSPTGVAPNMLRICLNHPGPIPDPARRGFFITDPFFDTRFSLTCYTLDFWPGKTTYLDTPVIPVSAYTAVFDASLDCEFPDGTPVFSDVTGPGAVGPYVAAAGSRLTIRSPGNVRVPNSECQARFDPACAPLVTRDFGFGAQKGSVRIGATELTNVLWSNGTISGVVPAGAVTGQLSVTRADNGKSSITGITVTVGGPAPIVVVPGQSIQAAIDAAPTGALVLVRPGRYEGNIILHKNIRLQGSSAYSTIINAAPTSPENLQLFRARVQALLDAGTVALVPGENLDVHIEFAALTVLTKEGVFTDDPHARIDGFTLTSATSGGGISVNGYARFLEIGNNRIINNAGAYGGGIRIGTPDLTDPTGATDLTCGPAAPTYCSNRNDNLAIHHNHLLANGAVAGTTGGGGIAIFNGADDVRVTDNYICGNFTSSKGGGIAYIGLSPNGVIENNRILLNESTFNSVTGGEGGGILIQGEPARAPAGLFTPGTGSVTVNGNLIQANLAGNGRGGGILVWFPNGLDVAAVPGNDADWHRIDIFNNIIANNVAGWVGGGIFLQDATKARIYHNTIVNNSSTSTGANALLGIGLNLPTIPQGAGVVGAVHSSGLLGLGTTQVGEYANPELMNNIVWHNSSYSYNQTLNGGRGALVPHPDTFWDLQVFGATAPATQVLDPEFSVLTSLTGPDGVNYDDGTNLAVDPLFVADFVYALRTAAAPGEGGNTVQVTIFPIRPEGDYHLRAGSPAIDQAVATTIAELALDYDGQVRPNPGAVPPDIGADEYYAPTRLTLMAPNGGEVIPSGGVFTIEWTAPAGQPAGTTYTLQVSFNNGQTWAAIAGASGLTLTSFDWAVPALNTNSNRVRIRVQARNGAAIVGQDVSDGAFSVEVVKIIYPSDARVELTAGATYAPPFGINWRLNDVKSTVARARIDLSVNGGANWRRVMVIPNPAENTLRQETWTVPNLATTRATLRVLLIDRAGRVIGRDQSNTFFTILPPL